MRWTLPAELSEREQRVAKDLQRVGKLHAFLLKIHPRLFDEAFQAELAKACGTPRGTEPKPPALLAMVTLLQAYDRVGDAEAAGTARQKLKAMLDASPLLGAGRVEETWNLIGRALDTVVECAAGGLSIPRQRILDQAGLRLLSGTSLKATLDIDWDDPAQQAEALQRLLAEVEALRKWVAQHAGKQAMEGPPKAALEALERVLEQDLEPDPGGGTRIRRGVAKDRMPSLGDKEMRHGRRSKSKLFNGYKRHLVGLVGTPSMSTRTCSSSSVPSARPPKAGRRCANEPSSSTVSLASTISKSCKRPREFTRSPL